MLVHNSPIWSRSWPWLRFVRAESSRKAWTRSCFFSENITWDAVAKTVDRYLLMLVAAMLTGILFNWLPSNKLRLKRQLLKEHWYWETFSHWFFLMQVSLDHVCCYGSKQDICLKQIQLTRDYLCITPIYCNDTCCKHRMTCTLFLLSHWFPAYRPNLVFLSAPLKNVN